jgi:hypothetical protein
MANESYMSVLALGSMAIFRLGAQIPLIFAIFSELVWKCLHRLRLCHIKQFLQPPGKQGPLLILVKLV